MQIPTVKALKAKIISNKPISILVLVIVVAALIPSLYFYNQYRKSQDLLQNPNQQASAEVKQLLTEIGKLIILPTGETPTIATVSDKTKLADQPLFRNAENGDKVLIYSNAQRAILYRPSISKIIDVYPINLSNTQPSASKPNPTTAPVVSTPIPTAKVYSVVLYNGTLIQGLASTTKKELNTKTTKFQVIDTGDAAKSGYTQTLVVDVGSNKSAAGELAGLVVGKVGELPSGEKFPTGADFLVILGSNK